MQVLVYGERRIPYRLRFLDRKRLRIVVKPDLSVTVDAPKEFNEDEVREALHSKARWIIRQLGEFEEYLPLPTQHKFISGETFVYLGRQYRLKVEEGVVTPAKLRGKFLHVTVSDKHDLGAVQSSVDAWYRGRAEEIFCHYLKNCLKVGKRHAIEEPTLTIRKMRTRWGSCTASGRITLNLNLIQAPVHCIEYVVMHELCHLVHHDHSPHFFRLLTRCMPDWKKRREILKRVVLPSPQTTEKPKKV